jgi:hypothetical protein
VLAAVPERRFKWQSDPNVERISLRERLQQRESPYENIPELEVYRDALRRDKRASDNGKRKLNQRQMKTRYNAKQLAGCLAGIACSVVLFNLDSARAQEFGVCTEQVLSAPTESSLKVRVTGVNQWPMNPICLWRASGTRADGQSYTWNATLIGDGLVENPTYVNAAVILAYRIGSSTVDQRLVFNCFCPYPSDGFVMPVVSDPVSPTPPEGPEGSWNGSYNEDGFLSFKGTISLDAAGNLTVDFVFTGGTPPPPTISDLIAWLNSSTISEAQKRELIAKLETVASSLANGNCKSATNDLNAFQNKVRAQISDRVLADLLVSGAQEIIDSACGSAAGKRR